MDDPTIKSLISSALMLVLLITSGSSLVRRSSALSLWNQSRAGSLGLDLDWAVLKNPAITTSFILLPPCFTSSQSTYSPRAGVFLRESICKNPFRSFGPNVLRPPFVQLGSSWEQGGPLLGPSCSARSGHRYPNRRYQRFQKGRHSNHSRAAYHHTHLRR